MGDNEGRHGGTSKHGFDYSGVMKQYLPQVRKYLDEVPLFQKAMGIKAKTAFTAKLLVERLSGAWGDCFQDGTIRLDSDSIDSSHLYQTIVHEYSHHLTNELITKLLGYKRGTPEFEYNYEDGWAVRKVQEEALSLYKEYRIRQLNRNIQELSAKTFNSPVFAQMNAQVIAKMKSELSHIRSISAKTAAERSGMRDYAWHQYSWTQKGTYFEIPSVATEMFRKSGYNWNALLKSSPYSYFVLTTLRKYLKKK